MSARKSTSSGRAVALLGSLLLLVAGDLFAETVDPADRAIHDALTRPVTIEFVETPIESVLGFLQDSRGLPIVLDPNAGGEYVSIDLLDLPLGMALDMVLEAIDHAYEVRDGVVFVSTKSRIRTRQAVSRFYDCRDLLSPVEDFPARNFEVDQFDDIGGAVFGSDETADLLDPEMLIDLITSHVSPERWDEDASVHMLPGMLVVMGTPDIHEQVVSLLTDLREQMGSLLAVDVVALALPLAQARAVLGETALSGARASVPCSEEMFDALSEQGRTLGHVSLAGFNSQQFTGSSGLLRSRVLDYDVEIASSSIAMDPVVGSDIAGMSVVVRPIMESDGKQATLDLVVDLSAFRGADRLVKASAASVRPTAGTGDHSSTTTASVGVGGEIQVREIARDHIATRMQLTLGQTTAMVRSSRLVDVGEVEVLLLTVRKVD